MPLNLRNTSSLFPYVRYSPQLNQWAIGGEGGPQPVEIIGKPIVFDIEHGQKGWLTIDTGVREWAPFPITGPTPKAPTLVARVGFSVLIYAPKTLGSSEVFELCSNTAAHASFMERLYNECEPEFGKNEVPVVVITGSTAVKIGKGTSRELSYHISRWIARPPALVEALKRRDGGAESADFEDDFAHAKASEPKDSVVTSGRRPQPKEEPPEEQLVDADLDDEIPF